jgi:hypothetical protein
MSKHYQRLILYYLVAGLVYAAFNRWVVRKGYGEPWSWTAKSVVTWPLGAIGLAKRLYCTGDITGGKNVRC